MNELDTLKAENEELKKQLKNSKTEVEFSKLLTTIINLTLTIASQELSHIAFQHARIRVAFFEAAEEILSNEEILKSRMTTEAFKELSEALNFKHLKEIQAQRAKVAQA